MITSLTTLDELGKTVQQLTQSLNIQKQSTILNDVSHEYTSKKTKMEWLRRESQLRVLDMERQLEITKSEWAQVDQNQLDHEAHAQYTKEQDKLQFTLQTELKQAELELNTLLEEKENLELQLKEARALAEQEPPVSEEACILSIFHGLGLHFTPNLEDTTDSLHIPVKNIYIRNSRLQQASLFHIQPEDDLETVREYIWSNL